MAPVAPSPASGDPPILGQRLIQPPVLLKLLFEQQQLHPCGRSVAGPGGRLGRSPEPEGGEEVVFSSPLNLRGEPPLDGLGLPPLLSRQSRGPAILPEVDVLDLRPLQDLARLQSDVAGNPPLIQQIERLLKVVTMLRVPWVRPTWMKVPVAA